MKQSLYGENSYIDFIKVVHRWKWNMPHHQHQFEIIRIYNKQCTLLTRGTRFKPFIHIAHTQCVVTNTHIHVFLNA